MAESGGPDQEYHLRELPRHDHAGMRGGVATDQSEFLLERTIPGGWKRITLRLSASGARAVQLEFHAAKRSIGACWLHHAGGNRWQGLVRLPQDADGGRLTVEGAAGANMISLTIAPHGRLGLARELAARTLRVLRHNPKALPRIAFRAIALLRARAFLSLAPATGRGSDAERYRRWIATCDYDPARDRGGLETRLATLTRTPRFTLFLAADTASPSDVEDLIDSLQAQIYGAWRLLVALADGVPAAVASGVEARAGNESRIAVLTVPDAQPLGHRLDALLEQAQEGYAALIAPHQRLAPQALATFALTAAKAGPPALLYADEDHLDAAGRRIRPRFKPDWSPNYLLAANYIGAPLFFDVAEARAAGGFGEAAADCGSFDLLLRLAERVPATRIVHLPKVLLHSADSEEDAGSPEGEAEAVRRHLDRQDVAAEIEAIPGTRFRRILYALPDPPPAVSIVVPTRDQRVLLERCVESIFRLTDYPAYELIVVDNGSGVPESLAYLRDLAARPRVRVLSQPGPFNFSALNNAAVRAARGEIIGLLNDDTEVIDPNWLRELARHAARPEIGCVGAKLVYPDGRIQHAGIALGFDSVAGHPGRGLPGDAHGPDGCLAVVREVSAVTGACLFLRKTLYDCLGGLDESLSVAFNDIDLCLKALAAGHRNIWTPHARLYHHEGASRGADVDAEKVRRLADEVALIRQRWGDRMKHDPYYSPNLTHHAEDFSINA